MNENKIGSVKDADLILKNEEKEAYLDFVEHGGFAKMKADMLQEIEWEKDTLQRREKDLFVYRCIKRAIESVCSSSKIEERGEKLDNKKEGGHFTIDLTDLLNLKTIRYDSREKELNNYYNDIFYEFYKYLLDKRKRETLEEEFNAHYKLLHENLAKDKELTKIEYNQKLERYKDKVRSGFFRKLFAWLK